MFRTKILMIDFSRIRGFLTKEITGLLNSLMLKKLRYFEMVTPKIT